MKLEDILLNHHKNDIYPWHMPGHKRNTDFINLRNPYVLDITEITGFDNLHAAKGILAKSMEKLATLYGSPHSFHLINGSTCGILAAISACTHKGDKILVARNSHKAVYNAIYLKELRPVYLMPAWDQRFGIFGSVDPQTVKKALLQHPDIKLIVLTSPTFEGIVSDIESIAEVAHSAKIPLLVDSAHGAHCGFSAEFPANSLQQGADISVQSLHKTLPALTQTAALHVQGNLVDVNKITSQLAIFESSSPSYVLLAAADKCVDLLLEKGGELFAAYEKRLFNFRQKMQSLRHLTILGMAGSNIKRHPQIFCFDQGKIVVSTKWTSITGPQLAHLLLASYQQEVEMSATDYIIIMTSICDTDEGFDRLAAALTEIDTMLTAAAHPPNSLNHCLLNEVVMTAYEAESHAGSWLDLSAVAGKIAQEYVYAYPPGIPLVVPGERISDDLLQQILHLQKKQVNLLSSSGHFPPQLLVLVDKFE